MNNWLKSALTGLVVTGLLFFIYQAIMSKKKKQLFTIRYEIEIHPNTDSTGKVENPDVVSVLPEFIKRRAEAAGYSSSIRMINDSMLSVNFRHADDSTRARRLLTINSKLEFREIYELIQIPQFLNTANTVTMKLLEKPSIQEQPVLNDSTLTADDRELLRNMQKEEKDKKSGIVSLISFPDYPGTAEIGTVRLMDTFILNKVLRSPELLASLPADIRFNYGPAPTPKRNNAKEKKEDPVKLYLYAIRTKGNKVAELQNEDIKIAEQTIDATSRIPTVSFEFNEAGRQKWSRITSENTGKCIAIILGHSVITAPRIVSPITGGKAVIQGNYSIEEAKELAAMFRAGDPGASINILKEDVRHEKNELDRNLAFILPLVFAVATALAFMVFNLLKNR